MAIRARPRAAYIPNNAFPLYSSHAKGSHFWDEDGNDYIDYMCGYGPNVLGYCDEDVDKAALAQLKKRKLRDDPLFDHG